MELTGKVTVVTGGASDLGRYGRLPMDLFRDVININPIGTFSVLTRAAEKMSANEADSRGEPGVFDTPILKGLPEEARQSLSNSIPFPKRLGDVNG